MRAYLAADGLHQHPIPARQPLPRWALEARLSPGNCPLSRDPWALHQGRAARSSWLGSNSNSSGGSPFHLDAVSPTEPRTIMFTGAPDSHCFIQMRPLHVSPAPSQRQHKFSWGQKEGCRTH